MDNTNEGPIGRLTERRTWIVSEEMLQLVTFRLGDEEFGIDIK